MNQFAGVLMIISIFPLAYGKIMMHSYLHKRGVGFSSDDLKKFQRVYLSGWVIFGASFLLILLNNSFQ